MLNIWLLLEAERGEITQTQVMVTEAAVRVAYFKELHP
jgi:hypothetical protein